MIALRDRSCEVLLTAVLGILGLQSAEAWYLSSTLVESAPKDYEDDGYCGHTEGVAIEGWATQAIAFCDTWDGPEWSGTGRPAQTNNARIWATVFRSVSVQGSPSPGPMSTVTYSFQCGTQHVTTSGDESSPSEPGTTGLVVGRAIARSEFLAQNSSSSYEWAAYSYAGINLDENPAVPETWRTETYYGAPPIVANWSAGSFVPGATPYTANVYYPGFVTGVVAFAQGFYAELEAYAEAKAWYDNDAESAASSAEDFSRFVVTAGIP